MVVCFIRSFVVWLLVSWLVGAPTHRRIRIRRRSLWHFVVSKCCQRNARPASFSADDDTDAAPAAVGNASNAFFLMCYKHLLLNKNNLVFSFLVLMPHGDAYYLFPKSISKIFNAMLLNYLIAFLYLNNLK